MTRTVEHIVGCHRQADQRVAEGRPSWASTLFLKDWIKSTPPEDVEHGSAAHAAHIARGIFERMTSFVPKAWRKREHPNFSSDLEELFEYFEYATAEMFEIDAKNYGEDHLDLLDERIEELYNWADRHRIWIG